MTVESISQKTCPFDDITPGTCFEYQGNMYLRIVTIETSNGLVCNAIQLDLGTSCQFFEDAIVIPHIEAKVVIER